MLCQNCILIKLRRRYACLQNTVLSARIFLGACVALFNKTINCCLIWFVHVILQGLFLSTFYFFIIFAINVIILRSTGTRRCNLNMDDEHIRDKQPDW